MGISRVYVFLWLEPCFFCFTDSIAKANILVNQTGLACIADFGLLTIISDPANILSSSSYRQGGTARWMGPELIDPQQFGVNNGCPTKSSDCYALGMVIYETISGHFPFHQHGDLTVFVKVLAGERPLRGKGFTESLWKMLGLCWLPQPNDRPSVRDVIQCLESGTHTREVLFPPQPHNLQVTSASTNRPGNSYAGRSIGLVMPGTGPGVYDAGVIHGSWPHRSFETTPGGNGNGDITNIPTYMGPRPVYANASFTSPVDPGMADQTVRPTQGLEDQVYQAKAIIDCNLLSGFIWMGLLTVAQSLVLVMIKSHSRRVNTLMLLRSKGKEVSISLSLNC